MNLKFKRWQIVTLIAIILLVFLNPSPSDFAEYLGHPRTSYNYGHPHRSVNFLICSIYNYDDKSYWGIVKNFIPINKLREPNVQRFDSAPTTPKPLIPIETLKLPPTQRQQLDTIVMRMHNNYATDREIKSAVNNFKRKHGLVVVDSVSSLDAYYSLIKEEGADVPTTLASFRRTLSNDSLSRMYYNYLQSNGFDIPRTYDVFKELLKM